MARIIITNGHLPPAYAVGRKLVDAGHGVFFTIEKSAQTGYCKTKYIPTLDILDQPKSNWLQFKNNFSLDPEEHSYIWAIVSLCTEHHIDAVLPLNDVDIYLFGKGRRIVADAGITLCSSTHEDNLICMDKLECPNLAANLGVTTPITFPYKEALDWKTVTDAIGKPVVIKARFSESSQYVWVARNRNEFNYYIRRLNILDRPAVIQQHITGGREFSYHFLKDDNNDIAFGFSLYKPSHLTPSWSTYGSVVPNDHFYGKCKRLILKQEGPGFWVVQAKEDNNTGDKYLIEVNTRFGNNSRFLFEMINGNLPAAYVNMFFSSGSPSSLNFTKKNGAAPIDELAALLFLNKRRKSSSTPAFTRRLIEFISLYLKRPSFDVYFKSLLSDSKYVFDYYRKLVKIAQSQ